MADGTYERRGPREAELKRLQRIVRDIRGRHPASVEAAGEAAVQGGFADLQNSPLTASPTK